MSSIAKTQNTNLNAATNPILYFDVSGKMGSSQCIEIYKKVNYRAFLDAWINNKMLVFSPENPETRLRFKTDFGDRVYEIRFELRDAKQQTTTLKNLEEAMKLENLQHRWEADMIIGYVSFLEYYFKETWFANKRVVDDVKYICYGKTPILDRKTGQINIQTIYSGSMAIPELTHQLFIVCTYQDPAGVIAVPARQPTLQEAKIDSVARRAGCSTHSAEKALRRTNGDEDEAVDRLTK